MTDLTIPATSTMPDDLDVNSAETNHRPRPATPVPMRKSKTPVRPIAVEGHTTKRYQLRDEAQRTVAHLRHILNQKEVPGEAHTSFEKEELTLEWDE
jgi:hypothetical protein